MIPRKKFLSGVSLVGAGLAVGLLLSACGLGRDSGGEGEGIRDPVVAATVNGRPIYIEDVRAHAVARGLLQEGEDVDANSDAFYVALEELIQFRLFSMEAEARGLDREPDVRRQLEIARERVLAAAIYEEIDQQATNPRAIERLYRENESRLGQGGEVRLRQIVFDTREAADMVKRRLVQGEAFEALAFEININADGGDLGFRPVSDLLPAVRDAVSNASTGDLIGPIEVNNRWLLIRLDDRRTIGAPSLEELRPRIVNWLRFQEITQLQERLERDARIERVRQREIAMEPGEDVVAPADAEPAPPVRPAPDAALPPGQAPPPFPFPIGPGAANAPAPAPAPAHREPLPAPTDAVGGPE